uniref:Uncharacterized protein n=1 Tax=Anguilla anguilla TaxID=7936 RepID=A0A0E9UGC3_ANGAN
MLTHNLSQVKNIFKSMHWHSM